MADELPQLRRDQLALRAQREQRLPEVTDVGQVARGAVEMACHRRGRVNLYDSYDCYAQRRSPAGTKRDVLVLSVDGKGDCFDGC